MKHFNSKLVLMPSMALALVVFMVAPVLAQTEWTPPAIEEWFDQGIGPLISVLVVIGGYLSKWIPGLNQIKDATYRVFAFAVLLLAGIPLFGWDIVQIAISYFMSTSMYELVLQHIFKTPRVEGDTVERRNGRF